MSMPTPGTVIVAWPKKYPASGTLLRENENSELALIYRPKKQTTFKSKQVKKSSRKYRVISRI